jgi:molybdopterin-binding protein
MGLSARNQLEAQVADVQLGTVMAHLDLLIEGNIHIESVITRRSAEEMSLRPGDHVTVVIKSTDVMVSKP